MRSFFCGGNWNNGALYGVFAVNGNNARSNSNNDIGFRAALPPSQIFRTYWVRFQSRGYKGAYFLVRDVRIPEEKYLLRMPSFRPYL